MAAPKFSDESAARPTGWNRSVFVSVPNWRPIAGFVLTSPIASQKANSSSVLISTRGNLANSSGSPALRKTAETGTPHSSNFVKLLPETRKCLFMGLLGFQRCHVDRETIFHIGFE